MTNMGRPIFLTPDDLTKEQIEDMKEELKNRNMTGVAIPEKTDAQIIHTVEELEALDPDTYLLDTDDDGFNATQWLHGYEEALGDEIFPLAVIATGEQVRAARAALEKENT